ncbi:MAG: hypothetical protein VKP72_02290 [bacterium]|nr:hypothetical protein [bacterium]
MKTWMTGFAVLVAVLGGRAPAWAGWETYTAYRTEDVYDWVQEPTTHTVVVPDYGWVDQGAAVNRIALQGRVTVSSISAADVARISNSGTQGKSGTVKSGVYSGNYHSGSSSAALTGLKGREAVGANRSLISRPAAAGQGQGGGTFRARERSEQEDRRERSERDDRRERRD